MPLSIAGYATAHVKSGNYGGSTQHEVFPTEYNYSYFDANDPQHADKQEEFTRLINAYIASIMVNDTIKLTDYLDLLYRKDDAALQQVHARHNVRRPVGDSHQPKPALFFIQDAESTVLAIDPYHTALSSDATTTALHHFLREHAKHYHSTFQDAFYREHYGK